MTREDKCKLAIELGYTYNPETGQIFGLRGKEITNKQRGYINFALRPDRSAKSARFDLRGHQFAWYYVHREIALLDHINRIKSDNRIVNLRVVTQSENQQNNNARGYYFQERDNRWIANITVNHVQIYLGCFSKEEDARQAYVTAKKNYHICSGTI